VVGIRSYYLDSARPSGVDDRGIYTDALFVDTPDAFAAFNGNTDPSRPGNARTRGGRGGIAVLNPGMWYAHRLDRCKGGYLALCQRLGQVSVNRPGTLHSAETRMFGIDIYKGGYNSTTSAGSQTVHPDQWTAFIELAVDRAKRWHGERWNQVVIPYALLE